LQGSNGQWVKKRPCHNEEPNKYRSRFVTFQRASGTDIPITRKNSETLCEPQPFSQLVAHRKLV
ncbi:hypothetical protein BDR03DRAFT_993756, partial [Suillus americanus]